MKRLMIMLLCMPLLVGCAKTASETITESALGQLDSIEQTLAPECKTSAVVSEIMALRGTIKSQLSACEAEKSKLQERNNTLMAILLGLIAIIVAVNWVKIKTKFIK